MVIFKNVNNSTKRLPLNEWSKLTITLGSDKKYTVLVNDELENTVISIEHMP